MSNTNDIEERVIKVICDKMGKPREQVTRDSSFINDLGADSLDVVETVMSFEEEFEITIPDSDAEKIQTVDQAIVYITGAVAAKAKA